MLKKFRLSWISVLGFLAMMILFWGGIQSASSTNDTKAMENLERAIAQASVHCYAVEGMYPESLEYLKEHYAIRYNEKKYVVKYEVIAKNLRPQIRVIKIK